MQWNCHPDQRAPVGDGEEFRQVSPPILKPRQVHELLSAESTSSATAVSWPLYAHVLKIGWYQSQYILTVYTNKNLPE